MEALSAYQLLRRSNLGENTELLRKFGLQAPVTEITSVTLPDEPKRKTERAYKRSRGSIEPSIPEGERRFSFRVRLKVRQEVYDGFESLDDSEDESKDDSEDSEEERYYKKKVKVDYIDPKLLKYLSKPNRSILKPHRPNTFGSIKGVGVGTWWETRLDCSYDGIHRPTVAGIHPGPDGAYSVALSGGYEDDIDLGDSFTYTGEGGRDLKGTAANPKNLRTAPQSKDQQLVRGNLALSRNADTGNPVRVIRGYKLSSSFAPEKGYRYDGLYKVTKYWQAVGKSGFKVYKFQFVRCDPEPAPWHEDFDSSPPSKNSDDDGENDATEDDNKDWHGWLSAPELPRSDCLSIVHCDEVVQVHLVGDEWNVCHDSSHKACPSPSEDTVGCDYSDKELECSDESQCFEGMWCGWPPSRVPPRSDRLSVVYSGIVEPVHLIGDQWHVLCDPAQSCTERKL